MQRLIWLALICMGINGLSPLMAQPTAEAGLAARYFEDGEYENALNLYQKLYKSEPKEAYVEKIVACYEMLLQFEDGEKFLAKAIRKDKENPMLYAWQGSLLEKLGQFKPAEKLFEESIEKRAKNSTDYLKLGAYYYQSDKLEWALKTYEAARKQARDPYLYSGEIANIYDRQGQYARATGAYLDLYAADPENLESASLGILNMMSPGSQDEIEKALLRKIDKSPSDLGLRSILFDFYVLAENFYEAFIQVKSIDRLFKEDGHRVFQFAGTMRNNSDYELSNKAFDYLIDRKKNSPYYYRAYFEKATNGELQAFEQIPVDPVSIRQAVEDYGALLDRFGSSPQYFDAIYRRAYLMVFYLNELETAQEELQTVSAPGQRLRQDDWAKARLLIGDILLMRQEYNQAKLVYTAVSERFKDRQLGGLANYKLAQMAYYKGEFNLAEALLTSIKDNTSNDISNDAIKLNLTILDNTGLDTTTTALEMFAKAQLLTYQREYDTSLEILDSLAYRFPNHTLADEILWEKASIYLKQNELETGLTYIDRILANFPDDIYGDDALYTKARIYDYTMKNPELAMELYLDFLIKYPGSLYSVEVRKRIRELRQG